jgi:hypothetical protein
MAKGEKKDKASIAKAATQKKGATKVTNFLSRNGTREKLKKNQTTQSSLIKPPTIDLSPVSPNSESISQHLLSSKNTKLSDQLPALFLRNALRTDPSDQLKITADKLSTPLLPKLQKK